MTMTLDIPHELMAKIREFMLANKTGNVTLDVKEGQVLSWKITEHGRLCNIDKVNSR